MTLAKSVLRVLAVTGKELVDVVRRPLAIFSIVFGPFLVLAIFGLGFAGPPPLRTELVIPDGSGLPTDVASYTPDTGPRSSSPASSTIPSWREPICVRRRSTSSSSPRPTAANGSSAASRPS